MAAFLHASLFCASFVSSRCCFKLLRTLFIQLILGLPRGLFPPAFTAVTCFATFVSYLLIMFVRGQFQWRFWVTFDDSGFDKCLLWCLTCIHWRCCRESKEEPVRVAHVEAQCVRVSAVYSRAQPSVTTTTGPDLQPWRTNRLLSPWFRYVVWSSHCFKVAQHLLD